MSEREERRRTVRQHDLLHEGFEVEVVFPKAANMALVGVAQPALRQALAPPIHGGDSESARPQVADQFEIFLDELGPPLEDADGALATRRRLPPRIADRHPVRRLQHGGGHALGHRVGGYGNQLHGDAAAPRWNAVAYRSRPQRSTQHWRVFAEIRKIKRTAARDADLRRRAMAPLEGRDGLPTSMSVQAIRLHVAVRPCGADFSCMSLKEDYAMRP